MANVVYLQSTISGPVLMRRHEKQGRKSLPPELVKVRVQAYVLPAKLNELKEGAKDMNMKLSQYLDLFLTLGKIELSASDNC